jgi:membrane fusion protein, multidrug efflux system
MQAPSDAAILPGMTATVTADVRRAQILGDRVLVPSAAVVEQRSGEPIVWLLEEDGPTMTAKSRAVKLGDAIGGDVEIIEGLAPGDRIAVAGASRIRQGMRVRDLGDELGSTR